MTTRGRRLAAGFTLIEMMIVIAMIAILLAVAVPSFRSFISNYRATSAVNDLLQGVIVTRTEALKRGRTVTMAPVAGDWRNGWIVFVDTSGVTPPVYNAGEELIIQHDPLPSTITITGAGSNTVPFNGANYVAFDGSGYPRLAGGAGAVLSGGIVVNDTSVSPGNLRTLCLARMGRPRIVRDVPETCAAG